MNEPGTVVLPLSGWRFTLNRQPDGELECFAGPAAQGPDPAQRSVNVTPGRLVSGMRLVSGTRWQVRRLNFVARRHVFLIWGMSPEEVEVDAVYKANFVRPVPVYRIEEFWVSESPGNIRAVRVKVGGELRGEYGRQALERISGFRRRVRWSKFGIGRKR